MFPFPPYAYGNPAAMGGAADTLAGISFALRLQTHNGDNVPLGLYLDTACTTPATDEFDIIAGWKDELGTSGIAGTQATEAKRPILVFDAGVPTLLFDGVDDALEFTNAFQSITECLGVIGFRPDVSPAGVGVQLWEFGTDIDGSFWAYLGNDVYDSFGTSARRGPYNTAIDLDQQYNTVVARLDNNESTYWLNTGEIMPAAAVTVAWSTSPRLGQITNLGGYFFLGAINACLITSSDVSDATRLLIEDYVQNLQP